MRNLRSSRQNVHLKMLLRIFSKGHDRGGFTLIELLVAMLISGLIVSGLLYLVVEVLGINQKDASRSDTQRDMQLAMDYITRDLREAFYVYGTEIRGAPGSETVESCLLAGAVADLGTTGKCTGLLDYLPKYLNTLDNTPVLAFWKPEPLPEKVAGYCKTNVDKIGLPVVKDSNNKDILNPIDRVPCVSQRMYTLVVYSLNTENNSKIWKGRARIKRYALPHFTESSIDGAKNAGWVAPVGSNDKRPLSWPFGTAPSGSSDVFQDLRGGVLPSETPTDNVVLTDFVDYKYQNNAPVDSLALVPTVTKNSGYCPHNFEVANFKRFRPEFYACVRRGTVNENPEVRVVIKGNAAGRGGIPFATGEVPFQMESHVIGRAAYGKQRAGD